ncbi:MAG: TRAP transporter small permease [Clostridia bacterium]|nr:TRAP transporter small permease [Clostridia bacterium]
MADILRKIDRVLCTVLLRIAQIAMLALVVIVTYTVIARFVFNTGNSWAEEVPRVLVAIFAFLACAMGVRDHLHTAVGVLYNRLPEGGKGQKALDILTDVCVLLVAILMIKVGGDYCASLAAKGGKLPMTQWPVWIQYISIPISGVVMLFHSILFLTGVLKPGDTFFSDKMDDPMEKARAMMKAEEEAKEKGGAQA